MAPSASKLKKLKASLDCGVLDVQEYSADPHAIAGKPHILNHNNVLEAADVNDNKAYHTF